MENLCKYKYALITTHKESISIGGHVATVQWNDIKGNPLGYKTLYPNGVIETGNSEFTFTNNVSEAELRLSNLYGSDIVMKETNTYSNVTDRLTGTEITLDHGSGEHVKAVTYGYDDLGRLTSTSRLLGDDAGNHTVNYTYDMRGWTREINSSNGFMEKLWYQDGATPCYNGNISSMTWRNSNVKEWIPSLDYIKGDVNGDGSISMSDASMVVNYYLAENKPSNFNFAAADVNGDGYISMSDANQISNMYFSVTNIDEYKVYTDKLSIKENQNLQRRYNYSYDGANRMTGANYGEERTDGNTSTATQNYNEWMEYDQNGNITKLYRNGKMQNGKYGYVDKLTTMGYSGNQLMVAKDTSNPVTAEGSTDFKGPKDVNMRCTYNGVGSLTRDDSRGIALIEYDDMNNPKRIQFTNGNVTKYVYSATGEKLRTIYQTAVPNITVAVGTAHELTASELLYADSTDYYHGGKLTVKNGKLDKYYFDGGYAQATMDESNQSDDFAFFYYTADNLGNIREVIDEKGDVVQITNYYPFGTPYSAEDCATHNPDQQNHKYNGKEFDTTHDLNTYDYGARQYNSLLGRWDRIDQLAEKDYATSPYVYCHNNPINRFDPDGRIDIPTMFYDYLGCAYGYETAEKIQEMMNGFVVDDLAKVGIGIEKQYSLNSASGIAMESSFTVGKVMFLGGDDAGYPYTYTTGEVGAGIESAISTSVSIGTNVFLTIQTQGENIDHAAFSGKSNTYNLSIGASVGEGLSVGTDLNATYSVGKPENSYDPAWSTYSIGLDVNAAAGVSTPVGISTSAGRGLTKFVDKKVGTEKSIREYWNANTSL
ncbi:MAG: hypothetical protein K6G62_07805, partial [Eubacterium sp.]|nr:hypothetical protein [Eubacterium sp.]